MYKKLEDLGGSVYHSKYTHPPLLDPSMEMCFMLIECRELYL